MSPSIKKHAILTIDDGPTPDRAIMLDVLSKRQVFSVFFSEGKCLEQYPELGIATIRAGHVLANHSWSHPHFSDISVEEAKEEILRTDQLITKLYAQARVPQGIKLFRFPYGDQGDGRRGHVFKWWKWRDTAKFEAIQAYLRELGYAPLNIELLPKWYAPLLVHADTHWTFDVLEWSLTQTRPVLGIDSCQKVITRLGQKHPKDVRGLAWWQPRWLSNDTARKEIILMHDQNGLGKHFDVLMAELQQKVTFEPIIKSP
jgi:peptidoglycan-N-acetylglucosamine deacetylase